MATGEPVSASQRGSPISHFPWRSASPTDLRLLYLGPEETLSHVRAHLPSNYDTHLALTAEEVDSVIADCDVVLDAYMKVRFPAPRLESALALRLFVTATTGADHIDESVLADRGIPLLTLKGQIEVLRNITPAAEHSWLLLLACARDLPAARQEVLAGGWDRNKFPGVMLRGRTLGIIGCGRIGTWMARYATAFGMRCIGYDPFTDPWPELIERASLVDVLAGSDFVTVHVPLEEGTRGLLGPAEIEQIKRGAILINTSRGDVIDENALLAALEDGRLAGAGLDVMSGEPDIDDHPLVAYARRRSNLIITPHIGGFSPDALNYVLEFCCGRIVNYFGAVPA